MSLLAFGLLTVVSHTSAEHTHKMLAFWGAIAAATMSPAALWIVMRRRVGAGSDHESRLALRYAITFGVVSAFAIPIFGGDFWYYLAEGRLAASGGNVYAETLTAPVLGDLPVPTVIVNATMPYGPLWVWISAALSSVLAPHVAWEFAAYKALMFAGWLATLRVVYGALGDEPRLQLRSVLLLGWLPFPLIAAVGDAHNDIVMMALVTIWLARGTTTSAWGLVASVLIKYVSAAAVAVAIVDAAIRRSGKTLLVLGLAIAAAFVVLLAYWQDGQLIAGLRPNRAWRIYTPVALLEWLVRARGFPAGLAAVGTILWRLILTGLVFWYARRYWREPSPSSRAALTAALFVAIVLGSVYMHTHY